MVTAQGKSRLSGELDSAWPQKGLVQGPRGISCLGGGADRPESLPWPLPRVPLEEP